MSKTKNITYEELCSAVRPVCFLQLLSPWRYMCIVLLFTTWVLCFVLQHWHELRKPNGERYAYPTYLHAVQDCLRNRSEWSHLIEQGPKVN